MIGRDRARAAERKQSGQTAVRVKPMNKRDQQIRDGVSADMAWVARTAIRELWTVISLPWRIARHIAGWKKERQQQPAEDAPAAITQRQWPARGPEPPASATDPNRTTGGAEGAVRTDRSVPKPFPLVAPLAFHNQEPAPTARPDPSPPLPLRDAEPAADTAQAPALVSARTPLAATGPGAHFARAASGPQTPPAREAEPAPPTGAGHGACGTMAAPDPTARTAENEAEPATSPDTRTAPAPKPAPAAEEEQSLVAHAGRHSGASRTEVGAAAEPADNAGTEDPERQEQGPELAQRLLQHVEPASEAKEQTVETGPDAPASEEPATSGDKPENPEAEPTETAPEPEAGVEDENTRASATERAGSTPPGRKKPGDGEQQRPKQAESLVNDVDPTPEAGDHSVETVPDAPAAEQPVAPERKPENAEPPAAETAAEPPPEHEAEDGDDAATEPAAPARASRTNRKLDEEMVHQIRAAYDGTPESTKNLATLYNVSPQTVRLVALRKRWRQVPARKGEWEPETDGPAGQSPASANK